jgi:hypothetical protein
VLELLLEVVDRRSGARPAAVRPRVDVVEGVPGRAGTALDDDGIVVELGDRDLLPAGRRVALREDGDARL